MRKAPAGLGSRGRAFWRRISDAFQFGDAEAELLVETCRTLDVVERLEQALGAELVVAGRVSGAVSEIRQQRALLAKLLSQLGIPSDEAPESLATLRARKAAQSRWSHHVRRGEAT